MGWESPRRWLALATTLTILTPLFVPLLFFAITAWIAYYRTRRLARACKDPEEARRMGILRLCMRYYYKDRDP
ncbi:hypothetical protein [Vulcanisaeta souniana]|uniref:Uncharacterized protein n=1 Tax=Vulcanisaeta souniana JCM 11219 TaxID=1293586 RepID=A0A830E3F9_9CREN|nr:hypothetical protein [Vulcanisaeta souniana]BDR93196.1 hypothetical protein Vsou_22890 [Vulcanisaeta souniana JCM 11219]GGI78327.1 hypothetical protein GCM10007112_13960 [Vulcanisaeta souniana JCM 11219]